MERLIKKGETSDFFTDLSTKLKLSAKLESFNFC